MAWKVCSTAQSRPTCELSEVFVPLTLRLFQPLRRQEIEALAAQMQGDTARAYLRLATATTTERPAGDPRPLVNPA